MFQLKILIPNEEELFAYQKALLAVLSKIEISDCDEVLLENVKAVYKLLNRLIMDSQITGFTEPQTQDT